MDNHIVEDHSSEGKSLADTAEGAETVLRLQYKQILENRGISGDRIRKYGFAFEGKEVLIKS